MTQAKSGGDAPAKRNAERDSGEFNRIDFSRTSLTPDELISRLRTALSRDGDFPASAKIVSELRQLTSDPKTTANQITEVILREPSLGTRVLHLVNSSFYRRAKPIMTVSQAVIQIGMRPLAEMCAGLVLLQKFVPAARQGGSFANCLRKTVLTSLLSSSLAPHTAAASGVRPGKGDEFGFLAGSFAELGTLLLAFYFPQLYDAAVKRSESKQQNIAKSILELTGLSPFQLSMEVIDALQLPSFYRDVLMDAERLSAASPKSGDVQNSPTAPIAKAVSASAMLSTALVSGKTREQLDTVLAEVRTKFGVEAKTLNKVVGELPTLFKDHCASIDLQLPSLPEFVANYAREDDPTGAAENAPTEQENSFNQYIGEVRQAVESREPTSSIITSVMETLAWGLKFDRIILLLMTANKTKLQGRLGLGNLGNLDPKSFSRPLGHEASSHAPDAQAIKEARPIFQGDPLLAGGWPLVAIPVGFGTRAIGVLYADRDSLSAGASKAELSSREQAAIGILAELLDRSISLNA